MIKKLGYIIEGWFNVFRFKYFKKYKAKQEKLFDSRFNICQTCDERRNENGTCRICGCKLKAKTKVLYRLDKDGKSIDGCPKKYW